MKPVDITTAIDIARPRQVVAAYATDPDHAADWYANIECVTWQTEKPLKIGTRLAFVARFLGRRCATTIVSMLVETTNAATGKSERACLVTLRTTSENFLDRDFARLDAEACLLDLSASLSKSPAELVPVRPVLEFNMVDPRFVEEADVLSALDQRPNLMELKRRQELDAGAHDQAALDGWRSMCSASRIRTVVGLARGIVEYKVDVRVVAGGPQWPARRRRDVGGRRVNQVPRRPRHGTEADQSGRQ